MLKAKWLRGILFFVLPTLILVIGCEAKIQGLLNSSSKSKADLLPAGQVQVIEYYYPPHDDYFMTSDPTEISILDANVDFPGWTRTGYSFNAYAGNTVSGLNAVCRFYGNVPNGGTDTHFYTANPDECNKLKTDPYYHPLWIFEGIAFYIELPTGANGEICSAGNTDIKRLYNNGQGGAVNHRYVFDLSLLQGMENQGWTVEGGVFCAPGVSPSAPPVGSFFSVQGGALAGNYSNLTEFCSVAASMYESKCVDIKNTATGILYPGQCPGSGPCMPVQSNNFVAPGAPPTVPINGQCGSSNGQTFQTAPTTNLCTTPTPVTPTAVQSGYSFIWSCPGSNGGANVNCSAYVQAAPPPPPPKDPGDLCALAEKVPPTGDGITNILRNTLTWPAASIFTGGGFKGKSFWVLNFIPQATEVQGNIAVSEYQGPSTFRDATLSLTPCDFRPADTTGANGPFVHNYGTTASIEFIIDPTGKGVCAGHLCDDFTPGVIPGQTYYFNVRNWDSKNGYANPTQSLGAIVNFGPN